TRRKASLVDSWVTRFDFGTGLALAPAGLSGRQGTEEERGCSGPLPVRPCANIRRQGYRHSPSTSWAKVVCWNLCTNSESQFHVHSLMAECLQLVRPETGSQDSSQNGTHKFSLWV